MSQGVISFKDDKMRQELLGIVADRIKKEGRNYTLSDIARPIFAIGLALIKERPELLDGEPDNGREE